MMMMMMMMMIIILNTNTLEPQAAEEPRAAEDGAQHIWSAVAEEPRYYHYYSHYCY